MLQTNHDIRNSVHLQKLDFFPVKNFVQTISGLASWAPFKSPPLEMLQQASFEHASILNIRFTYNSGA